MLPVPLLVVIGGPTASGKTELALKVASAFNTEIISADSRQFYREIPIGTAQPSAEEMQAVKHHFIGNLSVKEFLSAGEYAIQCRQLLEHLFKTNKIVVMTGGSGLYIDAVLHGVDEFPEVDPQIRAQLNEGLENSGIQHLQEQLKALDPDWFDQIDLSNHRRLIRALEVCIATGKPYSSFLQQRKETLPYKVVLAGIDWPRATLYERINQRTEKMLHAGLEKEARSVYNFRDLPALKTVGFAEMFDYFDEKYDLNDATLLIAQHTRNYAKRQMTWFRKYEQMKWFAPGATDAVISWIKSEAA